MRSRSFDLEGLVELPSLRDTSNRRSSFRSAMASLARAASVEMSSPLEGVAPQSLDRSMKLALDAGFFDDLDWLSPEAVGVALFEIASTLPPGASKRELGRRLLNRIHEADATTFMAIATRMVRSSRKGLDSPQMKARIALSLSLGHLVDVGPLAHALVSRRELARSWVHEQATASLFARRTSARILEHATFVAARRMLQGDEMAGRVFSSELLSEPFEWLLADREPLVWRHAAIARGYLGGASPGRAPAWRAIIDALRPDLSITEWRRGIVSLTAAISLAPERALPRLRETLGSSLPVRDKGLVSTLVCGLAKPLEMEPEAAHEVLSICFEKDPIGTAEGLGLLARELRKESAQKALLLAKEALLASIDSSKEIDEDGVIKRALIQELSEDLADDPSLFASIHRALSAFASEGARAAYQHAADALETASGGVASLESLVFKDGAAQSSIARRTSVLLLRDLDRSLLEDASLACLLHLRRSSEERESATGPVNPIGELDSCIDRLGEWLLSHERTNPALQSAHGSEARAMAMSGRRLRALLHWLDRDASGSAMFSSSGDEDSDGAFRKGMLLRTRRAVASLLERLPRERETPLRRTLAATLARALDALVRDGACDATDALLLIAEQIDNADDIAMLAEASMGRELALLLKAYADFVRGTESLGPQSRMDSSAPISVFSTEAMPDSAEDIDSLQEDGVHKGMTAPLMRLAEALNEAGSSRAESLRALFVRMAHALYAMSLSQSREQVIVEREDGLEALAGCLFSYGQMLSGAKIRALGDEQHLFASTPWQESSSSSSVPAFSSATVALTSKLAGALVRPQQVDTHVQSALDDVYAFIPISIIGLVSGVLAHISVLPLQSSAPIVQSRKQKRDLPAWLGARRTIGGFFIERALGSGATSSVFVAKRIEERNEADAEKFALKVPDYDGGAARNLSEQEFLAFFRGEASALLVLPPAPNLARFVTFDLGAKPKPILVMELIDGPTLESFLETTKAQSIQASKAFDILDGVLAGLEIMHQHGIGHLDVKPSNVILRHGRVPTLVDFGLAGRTIRPGCATGAYGAPEIWGEMPSDMKSPSPLHADIYAFGALTFEVLTGETLFQADNDVAMIGQHLVHDGHPPKLDVFRQFNELVYLIENTLKKDPRKRTNVMQTRDALRTCAAIFGKLPWPLK